MLSCSATTAFETDRETGLGAAAAPDVTGFRGPSSETPSLAPALCPLFTSGQVGTRTPSVWTVSRIPGWRLPLVAVLLCRPHVGRQPSSRFSVVLQPRSHWPAPSPGCENRGSGHVPEVTETPEPLTRSLWGTDPLICGLAAAGAAAVILSDSNDSGRCLSENRSPRSSGPQTSGSCQVVRSLAAAGGGRRGHRHSPRAPSPRGPGSWEPVRMRRPGSDSLR